MLNFYPGPSKLYPTIKSYALEAFESGILEMNHRSEPFMELLENCTNLLKQHLNIPKDYKVYFTSSATECWEICAQSFLGKLPAKFLHNGAFGAKWALYTSRITDQVVLTEFNINEEYHYHSDSPEDICFVSNETSNGTFLNPENIHSNDGLILIDAVSSLGGIDYNIASADIWIASSQKCLGLPSGMGIMIVSPKALQRAREIGEYKHYNSALFLEENFKNSQTPYTPNILAIYLLKRHLESLENVSIIAQKIGSRAKEIYSYFEDNTNFELLIKNKAVQSPTVITVKYHNINQLNAYLSKNKVVIGKGYGNWKQTTFRVANFPAIKDSDFKHLFEIFASFAEN